MKPCIDQSARYEIWVQGRLDQTWEPYFDNLEICASPLSNGVAGTCLKGRLPDQAALQGTLQKLYALGLALVSVEKVEDIEYG